MAPTTSFAQILDRAIDTQTDTPLRHVHADVGLGLSSGVWRAMQVPLPPRRRPADPTELAVKARPAPARLAQPPAQARWSLRQRVALRNMEDLGATWSGRPDLSTVKRTYWRLARQLHPDMQPAGAPICTDGFCALQAAWETLRSGPKAAKTGVFRPM
jgi:hypothetical protein